MTDETSPVPPAEAPAAPPGPAPATPPPAAAPAAPHQPPVWSKVVQSLTPSLVVALVALVIAVLQWAGAQKDYAQLQTELARRLAETETSNKETRLIADQVRNTLRDIESRMGVMDARLIETQNQRIALETLYQELARNRDEWVLAEIEQILVAASQQLQLAGNVRAALIALEAADKRLAQADRPGLLALRRVIVRDMERLKAAPVVDVPGMTLKLDNVIAGIDDFPLAAEQRPSVQAEPPIDPGSNFLTRLFLQAWRDVRDLLVIRVADTREVPLLAPNQSFFLRENLKLKLLSARLALLARDESGFRADLRLASKWLRQYFDVRDKSVEAAETLLRKYGDAELAIQIPDIGDSLQAVRAQQTGRKGGLR